MIRSARLHLFGLLLMVGVNGAFGQQPATSPDGETPTQRQDPATPIPPLTDEDRAAAFPDLEGHPTHEGTLNYYVLFDQLEWRKGNGEKTGNWDSIGWFGGDINRLWFRTEGEVDRDAVTHAEGHLLYGRSFSRWWDFVGGIRQDVRPGPAQTWGAVGIQGLAPNFFHIEAMAYVGASWRTEARLKAEYELLVTNRLIAQPLAEINLAGKSDPRRNVGSGLTTAEAGLRLRYEFRREFAPYIGIAWDHKFGGTADFARAQGDPIRSTRLAVGVRFWF